jgi:hypothetical protein
VFAEQSTRAENSTVQYSVRPSRLDKSMAVLQRQLRDHLGRTRKVQPTSVERRVVEGRVVNLRVEVASYVAASCLVLFPD